MTEKTQAVATETTAPEVAPTAAAKIKTFELSEPLVTGDGRTLTSISLRRGKVRDMRIAQRNAANNGEYEVNLIASLTVENLTPEDLDNMDMDDYGDIQQWFLKRKSK